MRRLVALGAFSLAGALIGACGDDDNPIGTAGSGGRAGTGGSAGTTGNAGNAGVGGIPGNGGTGGGNAGTGGSTAGTGGSSAGTGGTGGSDVDPDAGDGGGGPPCTGCLEITVPFTANSQGTTFQIGFSAADFTDGVITFRLRALTLGQQLIIQPFSTDNSNFSFDGQFTPLVAGNGFTSTETFIDLVYDLSDNDPVDVLFPDAGGADGGTPVASDHDKSQIIAVGFQLNSGGTFTTEFPDAATLTVLLDSITFTGVAGNPVANRTFADSAEGFAINEFNPIVPGSEITHHPE